MTGKKMTVWRLEVEGTDGETVVDSLFLTKKLALGEVKRLNKEYGAHLSSNDYYIYEEIVKC